jgi:hypothetical protein
MARFLERLALVCTALLGLVYGERLVRSAIAIIARLDPAHVHGVIVTGSALGFIQAGIAAAVVMFAVVPALLSVFDGPSRRMPAGLVVGELVAALLLLGASQHVLRQSVHARIVGTGQARVLALRASATTEAVE